MRIDYFKLSPGYAKQYREIRLESLKAYPDAFGSTFEEEASIPKLQFETSIEQEATDKFIVGAFNRGELVGICGFARELQAKSKHRGSIIQMYVKREFHGNKIGAHLLYATIGAVFQLSELEQLVLGVNTNNLAANKIYEEAGFQEYGMLRKYFKTKDGYSDQRLMILYKKSLT